MPLVSAVPLFIFLAASAYCAGVLAPAEEPNGFPEREDSEEQQLLQKHDVRQEEEYAPLGRIARETACTGDFSRFPSVLLVGMGHSGSTSLAAQMNMHPELSFGCFKEHRFWFIFDNPGFQKQIQPRSFEDYWNDFRHGEPVRHIFDADPATIFLGNSAAPGALPQFVGNVSTGEDAVKVVREVLGPDLKIIALFRDPVRMMNSFLIEKHIACSDLDCLWYNPIAWTACYADHLDGWLKVFPNSSMLFLKAEDYFRDSQGTLDKVFTFLGVSPRNYSAKELSSEGRRRHAGLTPLPLADWQAYENDSRTVSCRQRLAAQTGLSFEDWGPQQESQVNDR